MAHERPAHARLGMGMKHLRISSGTLTAAEPEASMPPVGLSDFTYGEEVVLHGLVSKPELNGRAAWVASQPPAARATGRVRVRLRWLANDGAGGSCPICARTRLGWQL